MTDYIETIAELEAAYGAPPEASLVKVAKRLTPLYRQWIMGSRFCVLTTVGPEGTDGSPRGDDGPVVQELDEQTLLMPDWRGNNRLDTLRNIVVDGRISLMFMVPGNTNVIRINGKARVTFDQELCARFSDKGRQPRAVIVIRIGEIYFQCARALVRAELWSDKDNPDVPSAGDILTEMTKGGFDGETYDAEWPARAAETMW